MMSGCGKPWCQNEYCKTGKQARPSSTSGASAPLGAAAILAAVRPLLDAVNLRGNAPNTAPFYLCTDQTGQQRRIAAEITTLAPCLNFPPWFQRRKRTMAMHRSCRQLLRLQLKDARGRHGIISTVDKLSLILSNTMHIVSQLGNDTVYALCSFSRVVLRTF
jgi:hypothetical protein